MPQLVKGGKYVYGWSTVGRRGRIAVPAEAIRDYGLLKHDKAILVPGSKRSGGFGVAAAEWLENSVFSASLAANPQLSRFQVAEGAAVEVRGRPYCWVTVHCDGTIVVPEATLKRYGVTVGDRLLAVRGSRLAIGFPVRGPIVEEARKHSGLEVHE